MADYPPPGVMVSGVRKFLSNAAAAAKAMTLLHKRSLSDGVCGSEGSKIKKAQGNSQNYICSGEAASLVAVPSLRLPIQPCAHETMLCFRNPMTLPTTSCSTTRCVSLSLDMSTAETLGLPCLPCKYAEVDNHHQHGTEAMALMAVPFWPWLCTISPRQQLQEDYPRSLSDKAQLSSWRNCQGSRCCCHAHCPRGPPRSSLQIHELPSEAGDPSRGLYE